MRWLRRTFALGGTGFVLAFCGFVIGLQQFDTLTEGPKQDEDTGESLGWTGENLPYAHGVLGFIVMIGACVNVLLFSLMTRPAKEGERFFEDFSLGRKIGHMSHRVLGHTWIILGLIACGTGTRITHSREYNAKFLKSLVGVLAATFLVFGVLWMDKIWYQQRRHQVHHDDGHLNITSNDAIDPPKTDVVNEVSKLVGSV